MGFFIENWRWISSNPTGFFSLALIFVGVGWGAARVIYHERLELLKELAGRKQTKPSATLSGFVYEPHGRHGRNLLANSVHDARVAEPMSFQATVPENSRLRISLSGMPLQTLSETGGAWSMSVVGVTNWTFSGYRETTSGASQHFNAEGGKADLQFQFQRTGEVLVEAFEGDSQTASWSKRVHVG